MKIIKANVFIMSPLNGQDVIRHLETCGRTCYQSEDRIEDESAEAFLRGIIRRGHVSVLEHFSFSVLFTVDRGISHEIVRHRLASYSQESTRYCNYSGNKFGNEITVIEPCYLTEGSKEYEDWRESCSDAEDAYFAMLERGCKPEEARAVLPNSLKTSLVMTTNIREWRHFFKLRCSKAAHPQMREVAIRLLEQCHALIPVVFDDVWEEVKGC